MRGSSVPTDIGGRSPLWGAECEDALAGEPRFRAIADYLAGRAPPGLLPGRQHIDAVDLRAHLPFVNLVDVVRDAGRLRYRFRLMGTAQVDATGRDMTGCWFDDVLSAADYRWVAERFGHVVRLRRPDLAERVLPYPDRAHVRYRRVVFPLARNGVTVDMLLIVHAYAAEDG